MKFILLIALLVLGIPGTAQEAPDDYLPADFHAERRQALREMLPENSVAVFFANPVRNRANDVDYVYHQDPDFYYLTGYREPHSVLLIFSEPQVDETGTYDELLFAQARNPMREMWTGKRLGPEGAKEKLKIDRVKDHRDFAGSGIDFRAFDRILFFGFHHDVRDDSGDDADLYSLIETFREEAHVPVRFSPRLQQVYQAMQDPALTLQERKKKVFRLTRLLPHLMNDKIVSAFMEARDDETAMRILSDIPTSSLDVTSLAGYMSKLREIKTPEEMVLLRKAIDISCIGQIEVMKAMHPRMSETEIQGIHEFVFKKYGAEYEGYPSIVGAGHNGCILHYIENIKPTVGTDLVLMDLGAEYRGYTADVTRTIPADGTFSKEQEIIYNIVLEAQEAGFAQCVPGNDFQAPHRAARDVIDRRLAEVGIIQEGQRHTYFPHGTSHYLGLDVHDRGTYGEFKPGTVITVEPGIYIPEGSPCDKRWWGIAVRIEDDVLITADGWENLSARAPRTVEDIEAMMAKPSPLDDFVLPDIGSQ